VREAREPRDRIGEPFIDGDGGVHIVGGEMLENSQAIEFRLRSPKDFHRPAF
jgi:hypothetical protein